MWRFGGPQSVALVASLTPPSCAPRRIGGMRDRPGSVRMPALASSRTAPPPPPPQPWPRLGFVSVPALRPAFETLCTLGRLAPPRRSQSSGRLFGAAPTRLQGRLLLDPLVPTEFQPVLRVLVSTLALFFLLESRGRLSDSASPGAKGTALLVARAW